jgi:hypothetical protein
MKEPSTSPLPPRAEFDLLLEQLKGLEDLSKMEPMIECGLRRLGRSLAQETVQRVAAESASPSEADFPPSGGGGEARAGTPGRAAPRSPVSDAVGGGRV